MVHVVPLIVEDTSDVSSQVAIEGEESILFCNARGLSRFTKGNIQQIWQVTGMEYRTVDNVDSTRNDILLIPKTEFVDQGVWECINVHMKSGVKYRTALIKLRVLRMGAKVDPERIKATLTTLILACGSSFVICIYIIIIASVTQSLGRRNLALRASLKKMNRDYVKAEVEKFAYEETTSVSTVLPHLLHRPSTAH